MGRPRTGRRKGGGGREEEEMDKKKYGIDGGRRWKESMGRERERSGR